ncbi:MAG: dimethylarginine dimethylaminohydrolase family protein [Planctomycetota bacterium]|jgi:dimethylargininase
MPSPAWIALVRDVSPSIDRCELTCLERRPIDVERARRQHADYCAALTALGCDVRTLPNEPALADAVFVEDAAVILDELAILTRPGAPSRRAELASVEDGLRGLRPIARLVAPATLDGGDVLRVGRRLYVGATTRTNGEAVRQVRNLVEPHGYSVRAVPVHGCLHLKSAATHAGDDAVLVNPDRLDGRAFDAHEIIPVDPAEPEAANVIAIGTSILGSSSHPRTNERLAELGRRVHAIESDELAKAEGALTCCSLLLRAS